MRSVKRPIVMVVAATAYPLQLALDVTFVSLSMLMRMHQFPAAARTRISLIFLRSEIVPATSWKAGKIAPVHAP